MPQQKTPVFPVTANIPELARSLQSDDPLVRWGAYGTLECIPDLSARDRILQDACDWFQPDLHWPLLRFLDQTGEHDSGRLRACLAEAILPSCDPIVRREACCVGSRLLASVFDAVEYLHAHLADPDPIVAAAAAEGLGHILKRTNPEYGKLGRKMPLASRFVEWFAAGLRDPGTSNNPRGQWNKCLSPAQRWAVIRSIEETARQEEEDGRSHDILLRMAASDSGEDPIVRFEALGVLGRIWMHGGGRPPAGLADFLEDFLLDHANPAFLRHKAAYARALVHPDSAFDGTWTGINFDLGSFRRGVLTAGTHSLVIADGCLIGGYRSRHYNQEGREVLAPLEEKESCRRRTLADFSFLADHEIDEEPEFSEQRQRPWRCHVLPVALQEDHLLCFYEDTGPSRPPEFKTRTHGKYLPGILGYFILARGVEKPPAGQMLRKLAAFVADTLDDESLSRVCKQASGRTSGKNFHSEYAELPGILKEEIQASGRLFN